MFVIDEIFDDGGFNIYLNVIMDHFDKNFKLNNKCNFNK